MTDTEMLQAMKELIEPLKQDISEVKQDISEVKQDILEVKQEQKAFENRVDSHFQRLDDRMQRVEVLLENVLPKQIKLVAEQYSDVIRRQDAVADYSETKSRLSTVELAVKMQSDEISDLKKRVG